MSIKSHIVNQLKSFIHSRTVSVNLASNIFVNNYLQHTEEIQYEIY